MQNLFMPTPADYLQLCSVAPDHFHYRPTTDLLRSPHLTGKHSGLGGLSLRGDKSLTVADDEQFYLALLRMLVQEKIDCFVSMSCKSEVYGEAGWRPIYRAELDAGGQHSGCVSDRPGSAVLGAYLARINPPD